MKNNKKTFCKLFNKNKNCSLVFISSNSGTGKTTFFKWLFLRRAVEKNELVDFFFRWENDIDTKFTNESFLKLPKNASKRLSKLAEKLKIEDFDGKKYVVYNEKKIARAVAINTQSKIKSTEKDIDSCRALFDEVLADDGNYSPNECYKFARLIDTRARYNKYSCICLYNNVSPFFPYKEYFKKSGAKFIDFVGDKFGQDEILSGIQSILAKSNYGEVYVNNNYLFYEEFFDENISAKNCETLFFLQIDTAIFRIRENKDGLFVFEKTRHIRKNADCLSLTLGGTSFSSIETFPQTLKLLELAISRKLLFTNKKNNTIYIKRLADFLNLCYTI